MTKITKHLGFWIIGITVFFTAVPPLLAQNFFLNISSNRLTLKTDNTPLKLVLSEIEKQSNVKIRLFLDVSDCVTTELNDVPLADGISFLLNQYNYALSFTESSERGVVITDIFITSGKRKPNKNIRVNPLESPKSKQLASPPEENWIAGEIVLHNSNPLDNDPLNSIKGIDPLVRYEQDSFEQISHNQLDLLLPAAFQMPARN